MLVMLLDLQSFILLPEICDTFKYTSPPSNVTMDRNSLIQKYKNSPNVDMVDIFIRTFEDYDKDINGTMNADEYRTLAREVFGDDLSDQKIQSSFQKLDRDHDGQLSFDEYMDGCMNLE
ncbi:hypothetical protein RU639_004946 [Aspergillus parasiticus]